MDRTSKEYEEIRDKALRQLRSGESLTGKDGAFAPLLKEFMKDLKPVYQAPNLDTAQMEFEKLQDK